MIIERIEQARDNANMTDQELGAMLGTNYHMSSLHKRRYFYAVMKDCNTAFPGLFSDDEIEEERQRVIQAYLESQGQHRGGVAVYMMNHGIERPAVHEHRAEIYPQAHFAAPHPQPKDYGRWGA